MKREIAKRLLDIHNACLEIEQFSAGERAETILPNRTLQLVLHKLLEIVGEALNQLSKTDPATASLIPNLRRYVDLRNQITHGTIPWSIRSFGKSPNNRFHRYEGLSKNCCGMPLH